MPETTITDTLAPFALWECRVDDPTCVKCADQPLELHNGAVVLGVLNQGPLCNPCRDNHAPACLARLGAAVGELDSALLDVAIDHPEMREAFVTTVADSVRFVVRRYLDEDERDYLFDLGALFSA